MRNPFDAVVVAERRVEIDWFRVVVDLERSGMTQAEIGQQIGRSAQTVNNLKTIAGTQPRFDTGMLLLGLWQERCARDRPPTLD